jgi:ABC-type oligopeptide transport system substrate-binding subunit
VHLFAFNRRRPLFARRSARLAASAALDRAALAAVTAFPGDPTVPGRPTDQFVPFGLPGFRDVAVHPLGGPDPEVVARLGSGRRPRRAVLYTCNLPLCLQQARVARRDLAAVRIDLDVKAFAVSEMFERLYTPGEPWDLGYSGWFPGYADGADFIGGMFAPNVSGTSLPGNVPDAALERRIRAATRLPDAARARAIARIDADLARNAAAAPISTNTTTDFFSDRIGCQVHQPIYGISLGALCLRR